MITNISISGFKCLKDAAFDSSNLNVLVGPNASGKSSVLQALLLLRQSADNEGNVKDLHLSGPLFEAGTAQDALHPAAEHQINITLWEGNNPIELSFRHNRDDKAEGIYKRLLTGGECRRIPAALNDRENGFAYLNAERVGPRVTYALPPEEINISGVVGKYGEYTAAVLARAASSGVAVDGWNAEFAKYLADAAMNLDELNLHEDLLNTQGRLDSVCNQVLGWILPGAVFDANEYEQTDAATLRFIRDPRATKASVRATHVGFGLIYTLPIITAALGLRRDGLMLVENPEAHLHPFSQSRIGVFLAMMAASGRQIFVETHSDHVINGIRLAVRQNLIPADNLWINFFTRPDQGNTSKIRQIRADQNGRLTPWPQGFFDQIENDLSRL